MRPFQRFALCSLLCLLCAPAIGQGAITYNVEPVMADKTLHVRMDIPRVRELTVRVQMPVWMPGAYFVGNFASSVADVSATDAGRKPLHVYHPDPNTWEIAANGARGVQVQYTVKNADLEVTPNGPRRGHISGPRTYMYVVGRKAEPVELDLLTPVGAKLWNIATSLDPLNPILPHDSIAIKVNRFKAPTYDVLADAPVEMGDFAEERFVSGGKPHSVVLYGQYSTIDRPKLVDYCKKIADAEIAFFGDAPFNRYVFQFRATEAQSRGAGGLEHLGSTEIGTIGQVTDRVRSVIAHEYFHLWNVKRIRPFVLGPFNYVEPPHTANLWWSEGVTSYYGDLLSLRGGLNTREEYLKHVGETIGQLQNNAARLRTSADEASLRVWEANNSQGFGALSYYTKGELIGLCLDLKIRQTTTGRYSLDDVIRALYTQVKHGDGPGFEEDDIKKTINRVSGLDLSDYYDRVARSVEELPFDECLGYAGMTLAKVEPPKLQGDTGMTTRFDRATRALTVNAVTAGGAADKAGIKAGDQITAVNGAAEGPGIARTLAAARPDEKIKLTVSQGDAPREVEMTVGSRSVYQYALTANSAASPDQIKLRDQWLTGKGPENAPVAAPK